MTLTTTGPNTMAEEDVVEFAAQKTRDEWFKMNRHLEDRKLTKRDLQRLLKVLESMRDFNDDD
jgi:hypothetical protein